MLAAILLSAFVLPVAGQLVTHDNLNGVSTGLTAKPAQAKVPFTGVYFNGSKGGLLYDNGPLITHPGNGVTPDTSRTQSGLNMSSYGFGAQLSGAVDNRIADEVIISDSTWVIDSVIFYLYQTYTSIVSTITAINMRVWNGEPGNTGSTVTWGNTTANLLSDSYWARIYRDGETTAGNTDRPVMACIVVPSGLSLPPGTWWLDFQAEGSSASGPWTPPITILTQTTTGNARQLTSTGWTNIVDNGTSTPQGIPFKIYGTKSPGIGIASRAAETAVNIFPNPANSHVTLTAVEPISMVTLVNAAGQMVLQTSPEAMQTHLDVSGIHAGIYVLTVQTGHSTLRQKLIIR